MKVKPSPAKSLFGIDKETTKKYSPQFKPLSIKEINGETVMNTEVSGTFDGSPIKLDYHFKIKNNLIENTKDFTTLIKEQTIFAIYPEKAN